VKRCWYVILAFFLFSCSPRALHEAQDVVSQADSLWQQGEMYRDSLSLAQAYSTLGNWKWFYADEYAHSCYHYGKLLRAQDDPVSAMQVFINATHTPTHDYHILGRVYSNMGSICHLADNFPTSYDMYEKSADMFLLNGDSMLYYFGLNNMAYELAEQGKKDETLIIIDNVNELTSDIYLKAKLLETKAILYREIGQEDSVLDCINTMHNLGFIEPSTIVLKAQAFDKLAKQDSALKYANWVLEHPNASPQNKFNALYIVKHCNSTLNAEDIDSLYSKREDIRFYEYEPIKEKWILATQLLEQDLNRKPDRRWILTLISIVLFLTIGVVCIYLWRNRKRHQQVIHDIDHFAHVKEAHYNEILADIKKFCQLMHDNQSIVEQLRWNNYNEMCEVANRYMYNIVKQLQPYNLSEKETRLCVLILLNATTEQMVELIPYAHSGLGKFKYTTARKLGTTTPKMRIYLLDLLR